MPVLLTSRESKHSYSNARKLPDFVSHILANRPEFSGQTFNFVDPAPVYLSQLILAIKSMLGLKTPKKIYIPYTMAKMGTTFLASLMRVFKRLGVEARLPAELMFLDKFYETQTLSAAKLQRSSFVDTDSEATIFTELPSLLKYYISRWKHLNLIGSPNDDDFDPQNKSTEFLQSPEQLLNTVLAEQDVPFLRQCALVENMRRIRRITDQ